MRFGANLPLPPRHDKLRFESLAGFRSSHLAQRTTQLQADRTLAVWPYISKVRAKPHLLVRTAPTPFPGDQLLTTVEWFHWLLTCRLMEQRGAGQPQELDSPLRSAMIRCSNSSVIGGAVLDVSHRARSTAKLAKLTLDRHQHCEQPTVFVSAVKAGFRWIISSSSMLEARRARSNSPPVAILSSRAAAT
jgi:hypothetical protein